MSTRSSSARSQRSNIPTTTASPWRTIRLQFKWIVLDQGEPGSRLSQRSQRVRGGQPAVVPGRRASRPSGLRPMRWSRSGGPRADAVLTSSGRKATLRRRWCSRRSHPATGRGEMERKFKFYEQYGVEEYYIYDPDDGKFEAWLRRGEPPGEGQDVIGFVSPRLGDPIRAGRRSRQLEDLRPRRRAVSDAVLEEHRSERPSRREAAPNERALDRRRVAEAAE